MKQKYIANGKRSFKFSAWPVIAFGYYQTTGQWDKYNICQIQTIFLLCFKLQATQYFQKAP